MKASEDRISKFRKLTATASTLMLPLYHVELTFIDPAMWPLLFSTESFTCTVIKEPSDLPETAVAANPPVPE